MGTSGNGRPRFAMPWVTLAFALVCAALVAYASDGVDTAGAAPPVRARDAIRVQPPDPAARPDRDADKAAGPVATSLSQGSAGAGVGASVVSTLGAE